MRTIEQIKETTSYLNKKGIDNPEFGVVLGTGLSAFVSEMEVNIELDYSDIPNFPVSTVEFHKGKFIYGTIGATNVLVMQGRFHSYEGYSMQEITFPIRVMKMLGVKKLLLSNASGGINPAYKKGDLVMLDDHINLQNSNPLTGKNVDELGSRFPDMSQPYSKVINDQLSEIALLNKIELKTGVYVAVPGPNLETRAEYKFLRIIGADMVGMSTVPEVIVANHMNLPCAAISVVTDECDPENLKPVDIDEIIEVAGKADKKLSQLFSNLIKNQKTELV